MAKPVPTKQISDAIVDQAFHLAAEKDSDTTVKTPPPTIAPREREKVQNPPPQFFTAISGGAEDQGVSQERSEALADFYNGIIETVRSTTHAAVLQATQNINKTTTEEEKTRHGQVMIDGIEAAACNAARKGVSEAIQEHPTCEVCKRYYYEGRGPKHPQHDPQDRLFKCINWPCKKWYHVGCLNIKYEMKDTYMCMGRFAPCSNIIRPQTQLVVKTEAATLRSQIPGITVTAPENYTNQTDTTISGRHAVPAKQAIQARPITPTQHANPAKYKAAVQHTNKSNSSLFPHGYVGPSGRPNATKGWKRCRGDGKCNKNTHEGNLPARCDFDKCTLKSLCSACKNNSSDPKGVVDGDNWFCSAECREKCLP